MKGGFRVNVLPWIPLSDGMPHTSRAFDEQINKTIRRGPRPDEVATYKRWEQEGRIAQRHAAAEHDEALRALGLDRLN